MNASRLSTHLQSQDLTEFTLTEAVRPAEGSQLIPREGFRTSTFRDRDATFRIPMLSAAVSAHHLFDVFMDLIVPLGEVVQVVLETSHGAHSDRHDDLRRTEIDRSVLCSYLCEYEDLLINDGCTGIAVLACNRPVEVQFDDHKQFYIYAPELTPFRRVLKRHGIARVPGLRMLSEGPHFHSNKPEHESLFAQLATRLGVGDFSKVFTDDMFS